MKAIRSMVLVSSDPVSIERGAKDIYQALQREIDAFGLEKGDELLVKVAKIFRESFRSEDIVARWGGDEFTMILPKINLKNTLKIIYRINLI